MKNHLDFTIDFETMALTANAAVMQVAIVPWFRNSETDPFSDEQDLRPYVGYVDLRSCVVDGFDFDPATIKWWAKQNDKAKRAVTSGLPEPIRDVANTVHEYIVDIVKRYNIDSICLWSQGSDVDIAILRNICQKYGVELESIVPHTSFRDCRTIILEAAAVSLTFKPLEIDGRTIIAEDVMRNPSLAYKLYKPLPERYTNGSEAHDALFDAVQSSWNTWLALKLFVSNKLFRVIAPETRL